MSAATSSVTPGAGCSAWRTRSPSRPGLVSLLVESSPASVSFWLTELDKLRAELPPEVDAVLRRHEAAGTTDSEEYQTTMVAFYDRHVCRVRPYPDWLDRCFGGLEANPEVYHTMNGPSEFHVIGPLKDFDVTADLGEIEAPTLLFCGEFDEVTPATVAQAHAGSRARSSSSSPGVRTWARRSGLTWRSAWSAAGWPAWSLPCGAARSWASCLGITMQHALLSPLPE